MELPEHAWTDLDRSFETRSPTPMPIGLTETLVEHGDWLADRPAEALQLDRHL